MGIVRAVNPSKGAIRFRGFSPPLTATIARLSTTYRALRWRNPPFLFPDYLIGIMDRPQEVGWLHNVLPGKSNKRRYLHFGFPATIPSIVGLSNSHRTRGIHCTSALKQIAKATKKTAVLYPNSKTEIDTYERTYELTIGSRRRRHFGQGRQHGWCVSHLLRICR